MIEKIVPIILCGGYGNRLFPLSTKSLPKQFLKLYGALTLFQNTVLRIANNLFYEPIIVSNFRYSNLLKKQLAEIQCRNAFTILEPSAKNTAISVTLAAMSLRKHNSNATIAILPADHYIGKTDVLLDILFNAALNISDNQRNILLFGISPQFAETNYGYIKCKNNAKYSYNEYNFYNMFCDESPLIVENFVEKPNFSSAYRYINTDNYYWNSGIYMAKVNTILQSIKSLAPSMYFSCKDALDLWHRRSKSSDSNDLNIEPIFSKDLNNINGISFDRAIIEKYEHLMMYRIDVDWYDLGSFNAIKRLYSIAT